MKFDCGCGWPGFWTNATKQKKVPNDGSWGVTNLQKMTKEAIEKYDNQTIVSWDIIIYIYMYVYIYIPFIAV